MKKKICLIAVLLLVIVLMSGGLFNIGKNLAQEEERHKPLKFGATYMTMNNPYFIALNESIREVVEANGDILITRDPAQNQERQNQQIQEMIDEGVSAIFANPVDYEMIGPELKACKEAGIPVFNIDTDVADKEYVTAVIQSDNYEAGVQCAKDMMAKKTSARIIVLNHYNIRSTMERVKGFMDAIADYPQYQVIDSRDTTSELEVAMQVTNEILKERGEADFDVVLGGNDPTALGALAALKLNHVNTPILIYGIDGSPDAKTMIKRGFLEGTCAQSPLQIGQIAAENAYAYLRGEEIQKNITVEVTMITRDNLSEFDIDGWQ